MKPPTRNSGGTKSGKLSPSAMEREMNGVWKVRRSDKTTELQLTNSIIEALNYSGKCWVWRVNSGMIQTEYKGKKRMIRLAKAGTSDIIGIKYGSGVFIGIEVKKPETRKTVTHNQQMFLEEIARRGGISGVATTEEEALSIVNGTADFNPYLFEDNVAQENTM